MPEFVNEIEKCFLHLEYIGFFWTNITPITNPYTIRFGFSVFFFLFSNFRFISVMWLVFPNTLPPSFATTATTVFFSMIGMHPNLDPIGSPNLNIAIFEYTSIDSQWTWMMVSTFSTKFSMNFLNEKKMINKSFKILKKKISNSFFADLLIFFLVFHP